jgi:hypothetical protein
MRDRGFGLPTDGHRHRLADYRLQLLLNHPNGYCPNHATGIHLPADFFRSATGAQSAAAAAAAIEKAR